MNGCLLLTGLVFLCCASGRTTEELGPLVNGRPMSFWLRAWSQKTTNASQRAEARRAFEQAGTNVIPYLLKELTVGDAVATSGTATVEEVKDALERSIAAEAALRYMGMCVTSAIPDLIKLLASTNCGAVQAAAEILSDLGPQGVRALLRGLTNTNEEARQVIPSVLWHLATRPAGTNLLAELPALFSSLDSLPMNSAFYCSQAIVEAVVSEFVRRLNSTNSSTRYIAARTLGQMGVSAQAAIPTLEELRNDPDRDVRDAAAWALGRIRGFR